jgi:hypothetical protein
MKYNIVFRIFICFIITIFVCSCSGITEVFDEDFTDVSDENIDLNGEVITYNASYGDNTVLGYEIGTEFSDLAKKRISDTENKLNCKLNIVYGGESFSSLISTTFAGTYLCDILCGNSNNAVGAIRAGVLTGIKSLGGIIDYNDFERWGNKNQLLALCYEDDLYGVYPVAWPLLTQMSFGYPLAINEDIVAQLSLTSPREYVETKTWTWEVFRKFIEDSTVIESGNVKIYGFSTTDSAFVEMFVRTNGDRMVGRDNSGKFIFGFSSDSAISAMEEARDILKGSLSYAVYTALPIPTVEKFDNGEAAMCCTPYIFGADDYTVSKSLDNFSILQFPYGPNAEPGYACGVFSGYGICITIPILSHDPEATATVLNELYSPLPGFETMDKIKEHMSRYYFFDKTDCDSFFDMYLSWDNLFNNTSIASKYKEFITYNGAVSSYVDSNRESAADIFEEYIMPNVRGTIAVWGEFDR